MRGRAVHIFLEGAADGLSRSESGAEAREATEGERKDLTPIRLICSFLRTKTRILAALE